MKYRLSFKDIRRNRREGPNGSIPWQQREMRADVKRDTRMQRRTARRELGSE